MTQQSAESIEFWQFVTVRVGTDYFTVDIKLRDRLRETAALMQDLVAELVAIRDARGAADLIECQVAVSRFLEVRNLDTVFGDTADLPKV